MGNSFYSNSCSATCFLEFCEMVNIIIVLWTVGYLKPVSIVTVAKQYLNIPQNGRVLSSMFHSYSFGNTELEYWPWAKSNKLG